MLKFHLGCRQPNDSSPLLLLFILVSFTAQELNNEIPFTNLPRKISDCSLQKQVDNKCLLRILPKLQIRKAGGSGPHCPRQVLLSPFP